MSEWISVEDRLPDVGQQVLCLGIEPFEDEEGNTSHRNVYDLGEIEKKGYSLAMYAYDFDAYATHWMPLPEPPKERKS